jgi:hypothetical protein
MLMQKIRDNAAWVVGIAVVCFGALIFVDWGMSPGNDMTHKTVVGTVAGEDIGIEEFDQIVQNRAKKSTEEGKDLDAEGYAALRREVFTTIVRERILGKVTTKYHLQGTPEQVLDFIRRNPPPGADKAPIFMGPDSQFSQALYERWLANPKTFDDRFMQMIEQDTRERTIPEQSLARILVTGRAKTSLEDAFVTRIERTRAWGIVVAASSDSFSAQVAAPTEPALRKEFAVLSDSFWVGKSYARIPIALYPKRASAADSLRARQDIDSVYIRVKRGEKFEDLAQQFSEDPGSAKNGGSLGPLQPRSRFVPAFSDAVAKLDKGQISEVVQTPFGYHVIRCQDRQIKPRPAPLDGADTLYQLQHILITVAISPETVDSLKQKLETARTKVKAGAKFSDAAISVQAFVDSLGVVQGEIGRTFTGAVVPGASAWAFRPQESETSEILETAKFLAVLGKPKVFPVGRDFDLARPNLIRHLKLQEATRLAKAHLTANLERIKACDTSTACLAQIGKLSVTPLVERPANSWIAGLGYAPSALFAVWPQAGKSLRTWTGPGQDAHGAAIVRIDSLRQPTPEDFAAKNPEAQQGEGYLAKASLDDWLNSRRREAKIKDNLDQFFRD